MEVVRRYYDACNFPSRDREEVTVQVQELLPGFVKQAEGTLNLPELHRMMSKLLTDDVRGRVARRDVWLQKRWRPRRREQSRARPSGAQQRGACSSARDDERKVGCRDSVSS